MDELLKFKPFSERLQSLTHCEYMNRRYGVLKNLIEILWIAKCVKLNMNLSKGLIFLCFAYCALYVDFFKSLCKHRFLAAMSLTHFLPHKTYLLLIFVSKQGKTNNHHCLCP